MNIWKNKKKRRIANIAKFWIDYWKCYFDVNEVWCKGNKDSSKIVNYEIILDYSQSMLAKISWETRISIAKKSLKKFIETVDSNTNVWLFAYGHKWWSDCNDTEQLISIWKNNRWNIIDEMNKYWAKWYTPIWKSLRKAWEILGQYKWANYENHILLISDWVESCKWNPIAEVKELAKQNIIVSVVGFDVNKTTSANLKEIADMSWWKYYLANDMAELEKSLKDFNENHACYMDKAINNLENSLNVMNNNFDCTFALNEEKSRELLDIGLLFDAPKECKTKLSNKTKIRYITINKKIKKNKAEADEKINKQKSDLESENNLKMNENLDKLDSIRDYDSKFDIDDMDFNF